MVMFHVFIFQEQDVLVGLAGLLPRQHMVKVGTKINLPAQKKLEIFLPCAFIACFALVVEIS